MEQYFFKLDTPRLTFAQDMSADEAALMQRRVTYWRDHTEKRIAAIVGPVLIRPAAGRRRGRKPNRTHALAARDPVIEANRGFSYEIRPMRLGLERT